jgi:hypothetical protein
LKIAKSQNKNPPAKQQKPEITERSEMITNWLQTVSYTLFASASILFCPQSAWKGEIFRLTGLR